MSAFHNMQTFTFGPEVYRPSCPICKEEVEGFTTTAEIDSSPLPVAAWPSDVRLIPCGHGISEVEVSATSGRFVVDLHP